MRGLDPDEHLPVDGPGRAGVAQVAGDRLADICGQRQPVTAGALADDSDLPGPPVEIVQAQGGDLAGAQPQPHQHGIIAKSRRPAPLPGRTMPAAPRPGRVPGTAAARPASWPPRGPPVQQPGQALHVQNRSSDRNADTVRCAVFGLRSPLTASTKPTTSALDRPARSTASAVARDTTNGRTSSA